MLGEFGGRARRLSGQAVALAVLASLTLTGAAWGAFPQDPPNDPGFDPAEEGGIATCEMQTADSQQHYLFSGMPQCSPGAANDGGTAGMNLAPTASDPNLPGPDNAWSDFTTGYAPGGEETVIAYIEGGINWRNGDVQELRNRVYLNEGELPAATTPGVDAQDPGNDILNADDFNDSPDSNGNGPVDPEDIIVRFSDGVDDDGNGYTDDISGWDFYDDQNDPATVDSQYGHANGQMKQAAAETNNGIGEAGICPKCRLLPIKGGAEALDRTDDLAESWLFAGDSGADVIVSVTADLGYSSFMAQAVEKLWRDGVVMVEASNDFNSTDHQGGMFHPHVLPGNGLVANTHGIPGDGTPFAATVNALTNTYRARASYPEWGTHNMFTAATTGGTTSESTPSVGGAMAMVIAYGKEAGLPDGPLSGQEAIQVVRETAHDIDGNPAAPLPGWEGKPGFDLQYGYGRPDVLEAMKAIEAGEIPPVAWIDSPEWYALFDPNKQTSFPVRGHVEAGRSSVQSWQLEVATGAGGEPTDGDFSVAASGTSAIDGQLGSVDLTPYQASFCSQQFELSQTKTLETNEQYTLTLRLRVTDAANRVGEERRSVAIHCDPSLRDGFPKKIGPGGESQPVMADLQGTGQLALVFGDSDGSVHAIDPDGSPLPGWPRQTDPTEVTRSHAGIDPGNEPIIPGVAVGDIDADGRQDVVATTTTGKVYVWDALGNRRPGWPKALDTNVQKPAVPRPDMPFTRTRIRGASGTPVLHDMNGDGKLEVIQGGWDGNLHVWGPGGNELPGFPLQIPKPAASDPALTVLNDQKITVPPAIAELDGDPEGEVVVRTQYNESPGGGLKVLGVEPPGNTVPPKSHLNAYNHDGSPVGGWNPATIDAIVMYYGSAQEFITEGANAPITADIDGDGRSETVAAAGIFSPSYKINPDGSVGLPFGPLPNLTLFADLLNGTLSQAQILSILNGDLPADTPVNFTTSGAFGQVGPGNTLSFTEPGSGAATVAASLLLAGSGVPINSYIRAHEAASGAELPGFPAKTQGLDFLGAPTIADVTGDGAAEIIEGGDSSALHAFGVGGGQAAGFPKFQSGWILFGPSVGDLDSDGDVEVAAMTREGYLMAWDTPGSTAGNDEWWQYRHDERNTALYGIDTRPPGIIRSAAIPDGSLTLNFTAPGDDWYSGTAASYEVVESASPITPDNFDQASALSGEPAPAVAETAQTFTLPAGSQRFVAIRALDETGNRGPVRSFDRGFAAPPGGGGAPTTPATPGTGSGTSATGRCANALAGDASGNRITGTEGGDSIRGLGGDDTVLALGGEDCVKGGRDDDKLNGGTGRDQLRGNKGDDALKGRGGRDRLFGGNGSDLLKARGGGRDLVSCGTGAGDIAIVDGRDRVRGCETVRGPARPR